MVYDISHSVTDKTTYFINDLVILILLSEGFLFFEILRHFNEMN
jgi:hypothetical protein